MAKELFNLMHGRSMEPAPLVYLHEHFKNHKRSLKNNWVWFSKEDIESIYKSIKQIKIEDPAKDGDGVRLYYGIYNQRVCEYLKKLTGSDYSDHKDHNTTFFVPTYSGKTEDEHIDCITKADAVRMKDDYDHDRALSDPKLNVDGYDVGTICPPPAICDGSGSHL